MSEPQHEAGRGFLSAPGLRAEIVPKLYAEFHRAISCEMVWVMNLEWWTRLWLDFARKPDDGDQEMPKPSIDDRILGQRVMVRDNCGEPHIEWMTRQEMGL